MSAALVEPVGVPAYGGIWPQNPSLYEINTWVWLSELSEKYGEKITLASVPSAEWDAIAAYGFDGVWLMGVWERSPAGIAIANRNQSLLESFRKALPDFKLEDNVGSPYCIRRYVADKRLGGPQGLAITRLELALRGMNLILDFVPNHVAPDHPWVTEHPEFFVRGSVDDARNDPSSYIRILGRVFACGRDPYFPAWQPDVLQLNAFNAGLRHAAIETVSGIAQQCDGIRCDMATLVMNPIFERTWGRRAGRPPEAEYWASVIAAVKYICPGFLFIAEAYWDLECELQQQGFDFCYDKKLYDRLEHSNAENIRLHLRADLTCRGKLVHFIENHDEPRAAATFSSPKQRAAALTAATVPGLRLFHEGQFEGRKVRPPVFLGRRAKEPLDRDLHQFYTKLLEAVNRPIFRYGEWRLCTQAGWPDNSSFQNLVAYSWSHQGEHCLIVVNLSDSPVQARVQLQSKVETRGKWRLHDLLSGAIYERDGRGLVSPGLYVELGPWNYHFFRSLPPK